MLREARNLLKRQLARIAYYTGAASLYGRWSLQRRAVVLMYHRVLPPAEAARSFSADAIVVTPETFDMQMRFLRERFNPVSVEEFSEMLSGAKPWRPRTCLVTFDDGWRDNVVHALPILRQHQIPALVFLATAYVGSDECFWQETLTALLTEARLLGETAGPWFEEIGAAHLLALPAEHAREPVRAFVTSLKKHTPREIERIIDRTRTLLTEHHRPAARAQNDQFMSWEEARMLAQSQLVDLGSHAHSHTPLTKLSPAEVHADLERAHREMSRRLQRSPTAFAYPNGDYDSRVANAVSALGYRLAFTTDSGWVSPGDAPHRLRRINIAERGTSSPAEFLCRLLAWF